MTSPGPRLAKAIKQFWTTREQQSRQQRARGSSQDRGSRSAVTGGAQMDGFVSLVKDILIQAGVPAPCVFCKQKLEVPGFFRPEKKWDLLVVVDNQLLATIEFKSQVGPSFGNNFNNRTEESLGSAMDLLTAYRDGAFSPSSRPWLGYLMLLEEVKASTAPVSNSEPHFPVLPEFRSASYARRYELLLLKLVRERLYDATCFLLASAKGGKKGLYLEPNSELCFASFAASLTAKAVAYLGTHPTS